MPTILDEADRPDFLTVEIVYGQYLQVIDRLRELEIQHRDLKMKERLLESVQMGMRSLSALESMGFRLVAERPPEATL